MRVWIAAAVAALAVPAFAEEPAAAPPAAKEAPAAAPAPAAKEAPAAAPAPAAAEGRPYVDAALTFLKSFTHTNRSGAAGAEAWDALRTAAADKVTIKIGGKDLVLDAAAGKTDAQLVRFAKLSTWRDGKDVKGVTLDEVEFKVGADSQKGKAKLAMSEKDGKWTVDSIEVE
ncbi:MAG: hypothetical protein ACXWLM_07990 [Myxococcales bacterium]